MRFILCFGLFAILTGGISVHDTTDFDNPVRMDLDNPPLTRIDVFPEDAKLSVPLLFHYSGHKKPYRLTMYLFTKGKQIDLLELDEVKIETSNGEVVTGMKKWKRHIKQSEWYGGPELFQTDQVLDVFLPRAAPFTISWTGRVRKTSGEVIPFSEKRAYKVRPAFTIVPYWFEWFARNFWV